MHCEGIRIPRHNWIQDEGHQAYEEGMDLTGAVLHSVQHLASQLKNRGAGHEQREALVMDLKKRISVGFLSNFSEK